jgi:ribonuclease-3
MREAQKYLEQKINYKFKAEVLLTKALTHRSYNEDHNERFEFLGDALLDLIIGEALYKKFHKASEGQLTRLRANLVQKETLIELASQFNINKYILLGDGELRSGGLQRRSILADCVEAIIAAVYLDSDFETCRAVVLQWYQDKINNLDLYSYDKDPKTILQEWLQSKRYDLPEYKIISETGTPHDKDFKIQCIIKKLDITTEGEAKNRRKAEQLAAGLAMTIIMQEKL